MENSTENLNGTLSLHRSPSMLWFSLLALVLLVALITVITARLFVMQNWLGFIPTALGGAGFIWLAVKIYNGRHCTVLLHHDRFETSDGEFSLKFAAIQKTAVGAFEFKPAGGILVKSQESQGFYWQPGLIWVLGRSTGVGGMVPKAACKAFAQELGIRQQALEAEDSGV